MDQPLWPAVAGTLAAIIVHLSTGRLPNERRIAELARIAAGLEFDRLEDLRQEYDGLVAARYNEAQLQWACVAGLVALDIVLLGVVAQCADGQEILAFVTSLLGIVLTWSGLTAFQRLSEYHQRRIEQVKILELATARGSVGTPVRIQMRPYTEPGEQIAGRSNVDRIRVFALGCAWTFGFTATWALNRWLAGA